MSEQSNAGPSKSSSVAKKEDRMSRLRNLQLRRVKIVNLNENDARKKNHDEVVEEDRRDKLPANHAAKQERLDWEKKEQEDRMACQERGEDYDRVKLLDIGSAQAERWTTMKKKKNPDVGFSDYNAASHRQYTRLSKQLKTDMTEYNREKQRLGEKFYADSNTLGITGEHIDTKEAIDSMVDDLRKQEEKRNKYRRRRAFDEDADVDYINDRNMKFNQKLERFYGKYTAETKQNLERGTAI